MNRSIFVATGIATMLGVLSFASRADVDTLQPRPVLLELFTSESCSSCPPADAYVGSLENRADVLALTFHVDYWNDLGWVDRLSTPAFTRRQRDYSELIRSQVYTPQLVIDGREDVVGSNRLQAELAIRKARQSLATIPAFIEKSNGQVEISIAQSTPGMTVASARMLLLSFDPLVTEAIHGGENGGRTVSYHNVVRSLRDIGEWPHAPVHLNESLHSEETGARVALIVQDHGGHVIALASSQASTASAIARWPTALKLGEE